MRCFNRYICLVYLIHLISVSYYDTVSGSVAEPVPSSVSTDHIVEVTDGLEGRENAESQVGTSRKNITAPPKESKVIETKKYSKKRLAVIGGVLLLLAGVIWAINRPEDDFDEDNTDDSAILYTLGIKLKLEVKEMLKHTMVNFSENDYDTTVFQAQWNQVQRYQQKFTEADEGTPEKDAKAALWKGCVKPFFDHCELRGNKEFVQAFVKYKEALQRLGYKSDASLNTCDGSSLEVPKFDDKALDNFLGELRKKGEAPRKIAMVEHFRNNYTNMFQARQKFVMQKRKVFNSLKEKNKDLERWLGPEVCKAILDG